MRERRSRRDQAYREARKLRRDTERAEFARQFGEHQAAYINSCMEHMITTLQKQLPTDHYAHR
jgi:hypothetical protein